MLTGGAQVTCAFVNEPWPEGCMLGTLGEPVPGQPRDPCGEPDAVCTGPRAPHQGPQACPLGQTNASELSTPGHQPLNAWNRGNRLRKGRVLASRKHGPGELCCPLPTPPMQGLCGLQTLSVDAKIIGDPFLSPSLLLVGRRQAH